MKKLIKSELKKILKSKMHILLIFLLTLSTLFITIFTFQSYGKLYDELRYYEDFSGKKISSITAAKLVDEKLHQYAGDMSDELYLKAKEDFLKLVHKYPREVIDAEAMKIVYGDGYEALMSKSLDGTLSESEFRDYMDRSQVMGRYSYSTDENGNVSIELYYEEDRVRDLIGLIYTSPYLSDKSSLEDSFDSFWSYYQTILINGKNYLDDHYFSKILSPQYKTVLQDDLILKSKNLPLTFDSVVPNNLLMNALQNILWVPLFIVLILLANIVGIEKQYHMEEIVYTTASSKRKITIAKLLTGTIIGVGVIWLQILVCFIVSYMILPVHTWNIVIMEMASSSIGETISLYIPFTYLTVIVYALILTTVGSFTVSLLTFVFSYFTKSRFITLIIMTVFLIVSWFIKRIMFIPILIKALLPFNMLSFLDYFYGYTAEYQSGDPYIMFGDSLISLRTLIPIVWIVIGIIIIVIVIKHTRRSYIYK